MYILRRVHGDQRDFVPCAAVLHYARAVLDMTAAQARHDLRELVKQRLLVREVKGYRITPSGAGILAREVVCVAT